MSGHTPWSEVKRYKQDTLEMGPRVARALRAESHARRSPNSGTLMALLIARRLRSFNVREGVKNSDARDLAPVPVPAAPMGSYRYDRRAGGSSL